MEIEFALTLIRVEVYNQPENIVKSNDKGGDSAQRNKFKALATVSGR